MRKWYYKWVQKEAVKKGYDAAWSNFLERDNWDIYGGTYKPKWFDDGYYLDPRCAMLTVKKPSLRLRVVANLLNWLS